MTTEDIKYLFYAAFDYAEAQKDKKPDTIRIQENGTIQAKWSTYVGCGEYEYEYFYFKPEDVSEKLEYYKDHFNN